MQRISINLLPADVKINQLRERKFYRIQAISVIIIMLLAFLASTTVALGVFENQQIKQTQDSVTQTEQKVMSYQQTESSLIALKDRVTQIQKIQGVPSNQRAFYTLITNITPQNVSINNFSIDSTGLVIVSVIAADSNAVDDFINNLLSKDTNEGKISSLSIDSLSRDKNGAFRMNISINTQQNNK